MTEARSIAPETDIADTRKAQALAADPEASAWVSANAGTGKTYVLVLRVLRLLLAGTAPDRILCLTYTKAAAAEMSGRLFQRLASWATADEPTLKSELEKVLGRPASDEEAEAARPLFARALETPGGLKVQTIHSFCERVLQRFPLEAGIPPNFTILDSESQHALIRRSVLDVLAAASGKDGAGSAPGPLGTALQTISRLAGAEWFDTVADRAVALRADIRRLLVAHADREDPFAAIDERLRVLTGARAGRTAEAIVAEMAGLMPDALTTRTLAALSGTANDLKAAERLRPIVSAGEDVRLRLEVLADFFMTAAGEPRKKLVTKSVSDPQPDLAELLTRLADRFTALSAERLAVEVAEASLALVGIADAVIDHYERAKRAEARLDYEDLIQRTAALVANSLDAQWVLYKLDNGLDHILVDEAQDTSALQWQVVASITDEFFSGSSAREAIRTIFAVGDEKQSIFGFQGAVPELFAEKGRLFEQMARSASQPFHRVPLVQSFRTVSPVLEAVDLVFADRVAVPGLSVDAPVVHRASRARQGGLVELWPPERAEKAEPAEPWSPYEDRKGGQPLDRMAARIAETVRGWLDRGEILKSENRRIGPGDVLILVRRRRPAAPAIIKALKARGIPVAGADRIKVTEQIGVEDMMALGDFLLLPEDDLALATVLKSPLIGLDDEDLFAIGHKRGGTLWQALLKRAEASQRYAAAADTLKRWRSKADYLPPYEFLATILEREGRRAAMLGRLGPEAGDAIDELLNLAIRYDDEAPPSLQGFLDFLGGASPEIRRDMDQGRDEVRVMTVHGAKGLEAPIVFLADTCSTRGPRPGGPVMTVADTADGEAGERIAGSGRPGDPLATRPPLVLWALKGADRLAAIGGRRTALQDEERREYHRLLYVAMTRARDRLYVAGFHRGEKPDDGSWYALIDGALGGRLQTAAHADGGPVRRLVKEHEGPHDPVGREGRELGEVVPLPDWALRPAPAEAVRAIPLAPSRLAPLESEGESGLQSPAEPTILPPRQLVGGNRFMRGILTHALLQHLPQVARGDREAAGERYLEATAPDLKRRGRMEIVRETLAVLDHAEFGALFGPGSAAEVPIAAEIPIPGGAPLRIAGQIDRMLVREDEVMIVDFKTNRPPPLEAADVARAYILQLAAYRLAVARIYPETRIRAALLWTDGARLMPIEDHVLESAGDELMAGKAWS